MATGLCPQLRCSSCGLLPLPVVGNWTRAMFWSKHIYLNQKYEEPSACLDFLLHFRGNCTSMLSTMHNWVQSCLLILNMIIWLKWLLQISCNLPVVSRGWMSCELSFLFFCICVCFVLRQELAIYWSLASNSWSSCLALSRARITTHNQLFFVVLFFILVICMQTPKYKVNHPHTTAPRVNKHSEHWQAFSRSSLSRCTHMPNCGTWVSFRLQAHFCTVLHTTLKSSFLSSHAIRWCLSSLQQHSSRSCYMHTT